MPEDSTDQGPQDQMVIRVRGRDRAAVLEIDGEEREYTGKTIHESQDVWATHIPIPRNVYEEVDDVRFE